MMKQLLMGFVLLVALVGCETMYYNTMEKVGIHKRDILIDRIESAQDAQKDGQEQFKSALEEFKAVTNFQGGELETVYSRLNDEYEDSVSAADNIRNRINKVDDVAEALFNEWNDELGQYSSANLRRASERKLSDTKAKYKRLIRAMRKAEASIDPVLNVLRDNVLYLKHNLNSRAISSLKGELGSVNTNVSTLIRDMQKAINESDSFIKQLQEG